MIKIENISKKFNGKTVISGASCTFDNKEVTVILGPSGSGKTTLIRCINKLEIPDSGKITLDGKNISGIKNSTLSKKVGIVFQNFNLFEHMSVIENVIFAPSKIMTLSKANLIKKADKLLEKLNILDKKEFMPHNLSGGQKQRVAIARCLMMNPQIIIFDEPTSALDPESVKDIVHIIQELQEQFSIIVVTHHVGFGKKVADRIIFMDRGMILADQNSEEFFKKPKSIRARIYLESVGEFN